MDEPGNELPREREGEAATPTGDSPDGRTPKPASKRHEHEPERSDGG
jgi:hypothetical protein